MKNTGDIFFLITIFLVMIFTGNTMETFMLSIADL